jgi:hypothetical protein
MYKTVQSGKVVKVKIPRNRTEQTSALEWMGGQHHAPDALPPGKDQVHIPQEAGWAPGQVWTSVKNFALTGIRW